ncbi:hypothetical protein [Clostridium rectalis]|uniref:hypothetical protein n=1 Tax=Clostridium rectalis TaxID=2040295 RepID=UPI000F63FC7C|nr:hypothetical protein [Clostridium rectalis]
MVDYSPKQLKLKRSDSIFKYISYIGDCTQTNSQLEFLTIKDILLIAINEELYYKSKSNKIRLLILLALVSLKDERKDNPNTNEIIQRMSVIHKYFNIEDPEIINKVVYFKPDKDKIGVLIDNAKNEVLEGKFDNVIFQQTLT